MIAVHSLIPRAYSSHRCHTSPLSPRSVVDIRSHNDSLHIQSHHYCAVFHCRSLLGRLVVLLISLRLAASLPPCNRTFDLAHPSHWQIASVSLLHCRRALAPSHLYIHLVGCSSHPVLPLSCRRALANTTHILVTSRPHRRFPRSVVDLRSHNDTLTHTITPLLRPLSYRFIATMRLHHDHIAHTCHSLRGRKILRSPYPALVTRDCACCALSTLLFAPCSFPAQIDCELAECLRIFCLRCHRADCKRVLR